MKYILLAIALIILPLLESFYGATLWGLNFDSPLFMAKVGYWLFYVKYTSVLVGFFLVVFALTRFQQVIKPTWCATLVWFVSLLLAALQIIVMFFGLMINIDTANKLTYYHQQRAFEDSTIYVYTSDPGAMGRAYHYFYLLCEQPLNRYQLELIVKTPWLGRTFEFEVIDNQLQITSADNVSSTYPLPDNSVCY
ncbi:hypothetical protein LP316_14695 [Thalassotalea sp. LPB0316]|uniref:hypothetical protein n=1 Tax=Thalassotalea sp. LPB0316 TaxID=2769490 RepID=UPI001868B540|nr:hypothetical protein [Thalassotalea sp. LPB0316]QOL25523.1 hypothetical protein LP316_14695 [Thalassotalea sp. LPB0316]